MSMIKVEQIIHDTINLELKNSNENEKNSLENEFTNLLYDCSPVFTINEFENETTERILLTIDKVKENLYKYLEELKTNTKSYDNDWSIAEVKSTLLLLKNMSISNPTI